MFIHFNKMKGKLFILLCILGTFQVFGVPDSPENFGCGLPTICGQGSPVERDAYNSWYQENTLYSYSFEIEQETSVLSKRNTRDRYGFVRANHTNNDNQTATITGQLELVRGSGAMSCTASFVIKNARVGYNGVEIENDTRSSQPLILEGPTVFPFIWYDSNSTEQDEHGAVQNICVPIEEDGWKMNLRRSLVSMINLNLHVYADLKTKGGSQSILGDDAEQIKQKNVFGSDDTTVTAYFLADTTQFSTIQLFPHNKKDSKQLAAFRNISKESDKKSEYKNDSGEGLSETVSSEWLKKLDSFSNFGQNHCTQFINGSRVQVGNCVEYQRFATQSELSVDTITSSEIRLESSQISSKTWNPSKLQMTKVSIQFDPFETAVVSTLNPRIISSFQTLMKNLSHVNFENPRAILDYGERMRKILPLIPVVELKTQYALLKDKPIITTFLHYVASSPSDDTVEFMVDLIMKKDEEISSEIFSTFLWTSCLMPTTENDDYQRYAKSRTHSAFNKFLDATPTHLYHLHYDMSHSDFLLHMAGLLNKEQNLGDHWKMTELLPAVEYILKLAHVVSSLESNGNGTQTIDTATHLQLRRAMERHGQQLDPDDDTELEDDYARLASHNPCSKKHGRYLENLFESREKGQDLKIMAYLFMRKCYLPRWKDMVEEYVESDEADKDVVNFILQHKQATMMSREREEERPFHEDHLIFLSLSLRKSNTTEILPIRSNTDEKGGKSDFGITKFFSLDTDYKIYSHEKVSPSKITIELNIVKGVGFLPRLISLETRIYGNDGEVESYEVILKDAQGNKSSFLTTQIL